MGVFFDKLETEQRKAVFYAATKQIESEAPARVQRQVEAGIGGVRGREQHIFENLLESLAKGGDLEVLAAQYQRAYEAGDQAALGVSTALSARASARHP
jgi:hypothetical protein